MVVATAVFMAVVFIVRRIVVIYIVQCSQYVDELLSPIGLKIVTASLQSLTHGVFMST